MNRRDAAVPVVAGGFALALAVAAFGAWVAGVGPLPVGALAIGAFAVALVSQKLGWPGLARVGVGVGSIGAISPGIDGIRWFEASSLLLVGAGILLSRTAWVGLAQGAAFLAFGLAWVALIGMGAGPSAGLAGGLTWLTALAVGALTVGTLWLRPRKGYLRRLTGDDPEGRMWVSFAPAVLLLPGVTSVAGTWLGGRLSLEPGVVAAIEAVFDAVVIGLVLGGTAASLRRSHANRQELTRKFHDVQETERRALAHELHDELGQTLTALGLLIDRSAHKPEARVEARALVSVLTASIRSLALELRPSMLDDLGLVPALRWLVGKQQAFEASLVLESELGRFSASIETAVFRIAQEALTNAARHAAASRVTVTLGWRAPGTLALSIVDDGRGFDVAAARGASLGLTGMRDRAELLGGSLAVSSTDQGTTLRVTVPAIPEVRR